MGDPHREEELAELLLRWEESEDDGQPTSIADLCSGRADLLPDLEKRIQALRATRWLNRLAGGGPFVPAAGRIIHGFQLVEIVGQGGFSQVWRAVFQGKDVAVKLVPINRHAEPVDWQTLQMLKEIRHPHIIQILGVWKTPDYLVIGMELAEETLFDRWREARQHGEPGIAAPELFEYFRQAADAIDFLHSRNIHHRDIKPQNLLLVGGQLKISDFGLARVLESSVTGHTGSLTLAYSAPEFFDGKTTRHSDQYCLAVTYCQMRGGRLPFIGTPAQIVAGHLHRAPNLTMLPAEERSIVARALAKNPQQRWASCKEFVERLATASLRNRKRRFVSTAKWLRRLAACVSGCALLLLFLIIYQPWRVSGLTDRQSSPPNIDLHPVFRFDGRTQIITPVDRFAPVTLEAWVKPEVPGPGREMRYFIGSDIPEKSGISIGMWYPGFDYIDWSAEPMFIAQLLPENGSRWVVSNTRIPVGTWSHVAGVFGSEKSVLFLNGRPVARGLATGNSPDTPFVIGHAGRDNPSNHFFVGKMYTIRISRGERYHDAFTPSTTFEKDDATLLLYDPSHVEGNRVTDLSGKGNHGVIKKREAPGDSNSLVDDETAKK